MMLSTDTDGFGLEEVIQRAAVSRETGDRLLTIVSTLNAWSQKINLVGPKERAQIWRRHVWDSLQLLPRIPAGAHILDIGSGGGFPALPLACCVGEHGGRVTMVETVGKKCAFLRDAVAAADLPANVVQGRIENQSRLGPVNIVTARAFAALPVLLEAAEPWFCKGATGLFHKGARWKEELTNARAEWTFACEAIPSQSGGGGVILKVSEVRRERA